MDGWKWIPRRGLLIFPFFALTLLSLALPRLEEVIACAVVSRPGLDVDIAEESALIIWDSQHGIEHFIRKANFVTDVDDFGFLVPTPTVPSLHESGSHVFSFLSDQTEPRVVFNVTEQEEFRLFAPGTGLDFFGRMEAAIATDAAAPDGAVAVIAEKSIAGYDTAVLQASDPAALQTWLDEHGYATRPELTDWLRAYTENGWYLTAFKFSRPEADAPDDSSNPALDNQPLVAQPIRLSFKTDKPFYPYREPSDMRSNGQTAAVGSRLLRLFLISDERLTATIGAQGPVPTETVWAGELPAYTRDNLLSYLPREAGPEDALNAWEQPIFLTELEDHSFPRQGTDELYLVTAPEQTNVERPPIVRERTKRVYSPDLPKWPFLLLLLGTPLALVVHHRRQRGKVTAKTD